MESLFSFFFKYRPFFFQEGHFSFQAGLSLWVLLPILAVLGGILFFVYRQRWANVDGGVGWKLFTLRTALFILLGLLVMRPSLVLSTLVPRENMLALLADNSKSMAILDELEPRGTPLTGLLSPESDFIQNLDEKFYLRPYLFDERATASQFPLQMDWSGDQSNMVAALQRVLNESRNLPLAAVVLFSDGADNSFRSYSEVIPELQARQIPVYTVGLGPELIDKDVEMTQISTARTLLPGSAATARVTLQQSGFGGSRGRVEVREGDSLVQAKDVYFPPELTTVNVELVLKPESEGTKLYEFTLQPLEGEKILENNTRTVLVEVQNLRPRILYVEGHPRWEYKFIRQSVTPDTNLQLETLLRTALNKFYRQGIQESTTLATGFPSDREELFGYKGIIFGSVESSFFTYAQMELVKDFVSKRGGGFMMLGGNSSFSSGNYRNTPIEQILPVWLHQGDAASTTLYAQGIGDFSTTQYGARHPALSLPGTEDSVWSTMPPLTDWNLVRDLKPGTTVLATLNPAGKEVPALAFHRFGRGQALAFLSGSSWRWQMLRDSEDLAHETFWRQILRWLVSLAKDPVTVETEREVYSRNEIVRVRTEVHDAAFNRMNDARIEASITTPSGNVSTVLLDWTAAGRRSLRGGVDDRRRRPARGFGNRLRAGGRGHRVRRGRKFFPDVNRIKGILWSRSARGTLAPALRRNRRSLLFNRRCRSNP